MITEQQLVTVIDEVKSSMKKRKFTQTLELIMVFKDIDVKKGFAINDILELPKQPKSPALVCVMASGDMSLKARDAKADKVLNEEELVKFESNKRESRKFINKYDFFLADTKLMPTVGKILGQLMGPRGKMPTPVPFNASIESLLKRFRSSIRIRVRTSLSLSCKFGDESMDTGDLAANALVIINSVIRKLPNAERNMRKILIKASMSKAIKLEVVQRKKSHV